MLLTWWSHPWYFKFWWWDSAKKETMHIVRGSLWFLTILVETIQLLMNHAWTILKDHFHWRTWSDTHPMHNCWRCLPLDQKDEIFLVEEKKTSASRGYTSRGSRMTIYMKICKGLGGAISLKSTMTMREAYLWITIIYEENMMKRSSLIGGLLRHPVCH